MAASKILFLLIILVFTGCSTKDPKPKGLIAKEKIAIVLADQLIGEAFAGQRAAELGVKPSLLLDSIIYPALYKKYDIDTTIYNASLSYYENDPQRLKDLFTVVEHILKQKNDSAVATPIEELPAPVLQDKIDPSQFRKMVRDRLGAGIKE